MADDVPIPGFTFFAAFTVALLFPAFSYAFTGAQFSVGSYLFEAALSLASFLPFLIFLIRRTTPRVTAYTVLGYAFLVTLFLVIGLLYQTPTERALSNCGSPEDYNLSCVKGKAVQTYDPSLCRYVAVDTFQDTPHDFEATCNQAVLKDAVRSEQCTELSESVNEAWRCSLRVAFKNGEKPDCSAARSNYSETRCRYEAAEMYANTSYCPEERLQSCKENAGPLQGRQEFLRNDWYPSLHTSVQKNDSCRILERSYERIAVNLKDGDMYKSEIPAPSWVGARLTNVTVQDNSIKKDGDEYLVPMTLTLSSREPLPVEYHTNVTYEASWNHSDITSLGYYFQDEFIVFNARDIFAEAPIVDSDKESIDVDSKISDRNCEEEKHPSRHD